jgi:tetratricopeptide (TPR) repeat protein
MTDRFTEAVALHEGGKLEEAAAIYRSVLAATSGHADARHLLGVVLHQQGDHARARELIEQAIAANPRNAAYYVNLGMVLRAQGKRDEAIERVQQALAIAPEYQLAKKNLGMLLRESGRGKQAVATSRRSPQQVQRNLWKHLGRLEQTESTGSPAVRVQPESSDRAAARPQPESPATHNTRGIAHLERGEKAAAIESFRAALALRSDFLDAQHNLAVALRDTGQWDEAEERLRAVIARDGSNHEAHNNLGVTLQFLGRFDDAIACYERALKLAPDYVWGHYNRSQVLLLQGRWDEGWLEHEWRFRRPGQPAKSGLPPRWDGLPRPGATLLVTAEQGLGDTLQFVRFLPQLRENVGAVVFECQPPLAPLLGRLGLANQVVPRGEPLPVCDLYAPLMSLPSLMRIGGERLGSGVPYLSPDPRLVEKWRDRLAQVPGRKIGIAWQGNPAYARDWNRSVPGAALAPLATLPDTQLVVLQKSTGREQFAGLAAAWPILDWTAEMDEGEGAFMDTAAMMAALDLVVTSDTSIVHLAGGLGVPVFVALAHSADWRWGITGEQSPWYPSLRAFRQPARGDWQTVFERIEEACRSFLPAA